MSRTKKELFWQLTYHIFAKNLPLSYHWDFARKLRVFFARRITLHVGEHANVEKGAMFNANVSVGDYSDLGVRCQMNGPVTIGNYVMMGPDCLIYTQNHKFDDLSLPMQQSGFSEVKPVTIGNDVWIGGRVIILPGVTIGDGCIIGAGAVVSKDVPPYSVAVGNPARVVKSRLPSEKENNK